LGNICRSPTAEGIMRRLLHDQGVADRVHLDSAGMGDWHVGKPPDPRAQQAAERRGYRLQGRARQFERGDFARFDYIVAMDGSNRQELEELAPDGSAHRKVHLCRDFDPRSPRGSDVPDPYYGDGDGFDEVFDICEAACRGLLEHVRREHGL
jgi:protein-tyrosine phosphatase